MGGVAVLVGPPAAIVITGPPAATPVPRLKARHEAMPLDSSPEGTVAEVAAKMTADPMSAAAIRRCRAGVHDRGANGCGSSKNENVSSHSVSSCCDGRVVAPVAIKTPMRPDRQFSPFASSLKDKTRRMELLTEYHLHRSKQ